MANSNSTSRLSPSGLAALRRELGIVGYIFSRCIRIESGCLVWQGTTSCNGYGVLLKNQKSVRVHRVIYEELIGPIPEGLQIDHVKARGCVSRACCEPSHLEAVTQHENMKRGGSFYAINARKTHCKHGHEFTAENTLWRRSHRVRNCRQCTNARRDMKVAKVIADYVRVCPEGVNAEKLAKSIEDGLWRTQQFMPAPPLEREP